MIIDTTNDELLINGQRWQRGGYLLATAYSTDQINITARDGRVIGKAIEWDRILDKDKNTFGLDRDGTVTALTNIFNSQVKSPYKIDALRDVENGTAAYGEVMIYRSPGEWQYETLEQYHGAYDSEAATLRSGATATLELYYTAQADGDGISELSQSNTPTSGYKIIRKLYYSERAQQDPDTGTWVQFADVAANTSFNDAKTALLAYLKERTGGTVPISLKMTWEEVELLLLEEYPGAAAAYSLRLLDNTYTGDSIRVRRASDNAEQDIGFDANGDLDTETLLAHCNNSKGYVKTWYDQSGNGNDATQTTTADQPMIVDTRTNLVDNSEGISAFGGGATQTLASSEADPNGSSGTVVEISNFQGSTGDRVQSNTVNVIPISPYTGSLYVKGTNGETITYYIKRKNTSATFVGSSLTEHTFNGSWQRIESTMTTLADTIDCSFYLRNESYSTADTFYAWGSQVEQNDTATDYILSNGSPGSVGHVVTENGTPALEFDGSNDRFPFDSTGLDIGDLSSFFVMKANVATGLQFPLLLSGSVNNKRWYPPFMNLGYFYYAYAAQIDAAVATANTQNNLHTAIAGTRQGNWQAFLNGNNLGSQTLQTGIDTNFTDGIGAVNGANFFNGLMQEIVVYDSDQSTNRTGIETDINDYYSIYP